MPLVNNQLISNPLFQLYRGDLVLFVQPLARGLSLGGWLGRPMRLSHVGRILGTSAAASSNFAHTQVQTPWFLEVDALLGGYQLIGEPGDWGHVDVFIAMRIPFITLKLYNWKFST